MGHGTEHGEMSVLLIFVAIVLMAIALAWTAIRAIGLTPFLAIIGLSVAARHERNQERQTKALLSLVQNNAGAGPSVREDEDKRKRRFFWFLMAVLLFLMLAFSQFAHSGELGFR